MAFQFLRGLIDLLYAPEDEITLDFKLHSTSTVPEFVWAIVAKGEATAIKKERWDLVSRPLSFFFFCGTFSSCTTADGAVFSNARKFLLDIHKNDGESATPS